MKHFILLLFISFGFVGHSQKSIGDLLKAYNTESVPYMSVQELAMPKTDAIILDSRELREFEVSHISNAIHVGYDHFNIETVTSQITDKAKTIVVYCSVGIRSENIGEQLKKSGFTNVYNLFGGIFEWKNKGYIVYDSKEEETNKVHTFSKSWSKWLKEGEKVYDKDKKE